LLVAVVLVGCDLGPDKPPTPLPTVSLQAVEPGRSGGGVVVASGEIVAEQQANLSFTIAGRVQRVDAALGDDVEPGQVLVALEPASLEAQVAQAEAAVQAAQANLDQLLAGPAPGEIALAETAIATARASVSQAEAAYEGAEAQCAVAQSGIASAEAALKAANAQRGQLETGARPGQIATAKAELELAAVQLQQAQAAYDRVKGSADIQMRPEALALEQATIAHEAAQALYQDLLEGATVDERRAAAAQVEAARVQVVQAENQARAACAQVGQASAAIEAARAQQTQAEQQLALLEAGPTAEQISTARAQMAQAEAVVQVARVALDQTQLRTPFAGTVSDVTISAGETVVPGQMVLSLVDPSHLRVETTDLSELDVARVVPGQEALVYVDALDQEIEGQVVGIAPQATTIGGDVVYKVFVALGEQPPGLRWGMSAEVEINTE
jgi:HlyD family secretion protein